MHYLKLKHRCVSFYVFMSLKIVHKFAMMYQVTSNYVLK